MSEPLAHVLIVTSRYYEEIAREIEASVMDALRDADFTYEVIEVPGAFEVPGAIRMAIETDEFDGFVGLGCVIRGETSHYDHVCAETARAMMDISMSGSPVGFGILTCENKEQAWVRADRAQKDKGREVADAVITMVRLNQHFAEAND